MLTQRQYDRLPAIERCIVDADRQIAGLCAGAVVPFGVARSVRKLVTDRAKLTKIADEIYGRRAKDNDGACRT